VVYDRQAFMVADPEKIEWLSASRRLAAHRSGKANALVAQAFFDIDHQVSGTLASE